MAHWSARCTGGFNTDDLVQAAGSVAASSSNLHALLVKRTGLLLLECLRSDANASMTRHYGLSVPFSGPGGFNAYWYCRR